MIRVQQEDFDIGTEVARLRTGRSDIGAIVAFVGVVRNRAGAVEEMTLEHYPGMTEAELQRIEAEASSRWPLQASLIVHRYGKLRPNDNIMLVVTASEHREAAFRAAEFLIDYLKTRAPFWKCESGRQGSRWVEADVRDDASTARWDDAKDAAE
ncbi:MAG TPA: molybdenum cofactor biosynthesis protein MoaE [Methyloceanibacter sp.]|nr:molybdenum cofactor biosynthesis protein MoaE [Methyloceanibacter sp.]